MVWLVLLAGTCRRACTGTVGNKVAVRPALSLYCLDIEKSLVNVWDETAGVCVAAVGDGFGSHKVNTPPTAA